MSVITTTRKRMGLVAIVSSIFVVASTVWGMYVFIQGEIVPPRSFAPHYEYDIIVPNLPCEPNFTLASPNIFDNVGILRMQAKNTLYVENIHRCNDIASEPTLWPPKQLATYLKASLMQGRDGDDLLFSPAFR